MVNPNGAKYWRVKYRFNGKEKTLALGVYPEINLSTAREQLEKATSLGFERCFIKKYLFIVSF